LALGIVGKTIGFFTDSECASVWARAKKCGGMCYLGKRLALAKLLSRLEGDLLRRHRLMLAAELL